jgi:SAM-dependent methyltransferase
MTTRRTRSSEQVRHHYEVEKELAAKLRRANRTERLTLYRELHDDLYRLVPHHPLLTRKVSDGEAQVRTDRVMRLLSPYLKRGFVFLEIGPGDCALSIEVATIVKQVWSVDVTEGITRRPLPHNCTRVISDGLNIPVAAGSVDLAFSNQLMEHLHPDDATEQLRNIYTALRTGGKYLCITPSRLLGPHDISRYFDKVATGFHLKEYLYRELVPLFHSAGFQTVEAIIGLKQRYARCPGWLAISAEKLVEIIPGPIRQRRPIRPVFSAITILGTK